MEKLTEVPFYYKQSTRNSLPLLCFSPSLSLLFLLCYLLSMCIEEVEGLLCEREEDVYHHHHLFSRIYPHLFVILLRLYQH